MLLRNLLDNLELMMSRDTQEFPLKEESLVSQAEVGSHLRGLRRHQAFNRNIIGCWHQYRANAMLLRREYRADPEANAAIIANFITATRLAGEQLAMLRDAQLVIQAEIDELIGQLTIFKGDGNETA